ncbi:hypothetical protein Tco_0536547 [Tanacetum coccineum]
MMEAYTERMNQQHEQKALLAAQREQELLEQEQAAQREQELLAQKQAAQKKEEPPTFVNLLEKCVAQNMGDKHLDTIPEMESHKVIKSGVENLVPILSDSEDFSDNESECDVPVCDESSPTFMTFSNPLFDSNDDFTSRDDE